MALHFANLLLLLSLLATSLAYINQRDLDKTTKLRSEPSKLGVPIEKLHGKFRQLRAAGPQAHEFHLNDTHSRGLIYYSGSDSKVIFVLTFAVSGSTVTASNLYRSADYGLTFSKINSRLESSGTIRLFPQINISPQDYRKIIIPDQASAVIYISTDEGVTFFKQPFTPSTINPRSLIFHPTREQWFLAHDPINERLYVSKDNGAHFALIDNNVNSTHNYQWGVPPYDSDNTIIYYNTNSGTAENHLYTQKSPYGPSTRTEFDPALGAHDDFLIINRYMFAQRTVNGVIQLYTSYDRKYFTIAHIPTTLPHQNYIVDDIKAMQALVIVEHTNSQFNLYLSEETGQYFSLSLPDIILSDLEYIASMNYTTYICNQYVRSSPNVLNPPVRTLISFDAGGNWETLRPPSDVYECIQPTCSLHLHMSSSEYWRTGVYSQSSAPGIIIAHGHTGAYLNNTIVDLYISRDGGSTWYKTLSSSWGVSLLDNGGLIVAAQDYHQYTKNPSNSLKYSCNEGKTWTSFIFSSVNIVVYGVITEPGEATAVASLYGFHTSGSNQGWTVFKVNFTNIFTSKCSKSDYYSWKPYDETSDTGCLLGASVTVERRNIDTCCLIGTNYIRSFNYTNCPCTEDDFECDYGYQHANGISGPCVRDESIHLADPCVGGVQSYMKSQGYRKVGGDVCSGGVEDQYVKYEALCCDKVISSSSTTSSSSSSTSSTSSSSSSSSSSSTSSTSTASTSTPSTSSVIFSDNAAILLGVVLLIAIILIITMFVVLLVVLIKVYGKRSNSRGYSRVPVHREEELTFRNMQRDNSPVGINNNNDDDDDERPLPL